MLKVVDRCGAADGHRPERAVYAITFKLAKVNRQAVLKIPQGRGISMARARGEKGDFMGCRKFDLCRELRILSMFFCFFVFSGKINQLHFSPRLAPLPRDRVERADVLQRLVALSKVEEFGNEIIVLFAQRFAPRLSNFLR